MDLSIANENLMFSEWPITPIIKIKESQSNYISFVNNNIWYKSTRLNFTGKILTYSYISTLKHVYSFCAGFSKPEWKSLLNVYR